MDKRRDQLPLRRRRREDSGAAPNKLDKYLGIQNYTIINNWKIVLEDEIKLQKTMLYIYSN